MLPEFEQPTAPGWYATAGAEFGLYMIYLLLPDIDVPGVLVRKQQWMAFTSDGGSTVCDWEYIEQCGPVVPLVKEHSHG